MATEKMITIDFDPKGGSKIEAHGFADNTCLKATKSVELLGPNPVTLNLPATRERVLPLEWPKGGAWTGPRPFVEVSTRPEFVLDRKSVV